MPSKIRSCLYSIYPVKTKTLAHVEQNMPAFITHRYCNANSYSQNDLNYFVKRIFADILYWKWNTFYLCGKILPGTDDIKMHQAMRQKIRLCRLGKNRFCTQAREKGAQWFTESNTIRVKNFRPTRPPSGSKNVILCFLANMRYIRDGICTGYIRRRIYISVPAGKKD